MAGRTRRTVALGLLLLGPLLAGADGPPPAELTALVRTLAQGSEGERNQAAARLRHLGDPRAVPLVLDLLDAPSADQRATACWVLRLLDDPRAAGPLLARLTDASPAVRREAARALGSLRSQRAVRGLIALLDPGSEPPVRLAAAQALAQIGAPRAARALLRLLDSPNTELKIAAIHALAAANARVAVGPLTKLLAADEDAVQLAAAAALVRLGSKVGGAHLIGRLNDAADAERRLAAVRELTRIELGWAVRKLTRALEDADRRVVLVAAEELARRRVDAGLDTLLRLLDHEDPTLREAADSALVEAGLSPEERQQRLAIIRGADPDQPRPFYVMTEVEIDQLVREVAAARLRPAQRIARISRHFLHTPYRRDPLGEGPGAAEDPDPVLRFDAVDCLTFVEETLALALSPNLATAEARLQRIRYRGGTIGFTERNHFTLSQWIPNNTRLGLLADVTREVAGARTRLVEKTLDDRSWSAPAGRRWLQRLGAEALPRGTHRLPFVSLADLIELEPRIPTGTLIFLVKTDRPELPHRISHVGLIISRRGKLYVRHAAERFYHRVVDSPMTEYLKRIERYQTWPIEGVNLQRVKDPWRRAR